MPSGLRVYDSSGNLTLDVTNRLSRIIYLNSSQSGSATVTNFDSSKGVYGFLGRDGNLYPNNSVTFDNSSKLLTWSSNVPGVVFCLMFK